MNAPQPAGNRPFSSVRPGTVVACLCAAVLLIAFVWPIVRLSSASFAGEDHGAAVFGRILQSAMYRNAFFNTFYISALVTGIALLMSYPIAYVMATARPSTVRILAFVVLLPFWTSALVRTTAWMVLLQRNGIINTLLVSSGLFSEPRPLLYNLTGVLIGMVHVLLPFTVLPLYASFRSLDQRLVSAAEGLGAGRWAVIRRIVVPLTAPGAAAGVLIVFMAAMGTFVTPAIMGGPQQTMVAQAISYHMQKQLDWQMASALSLILLVATLLLFLVYYRFFGFERLIATDTGGAPDSSEVLRNIFGHSRWVAVLAAAAVAVFLVAPVLLVFPLSVSPSPFLNFPPPSWTLRWFERLADDPKWLRAAFSSIRVAAEAITIAVIFGTIAAISVARCNARVRPAIEVLFLVPMIVPPIIVAIALYYQYVPLRLLGTHEGLAIGQSLLAIPLVFLTVRASLRSFDGNLELAAIGLGASWRTMFRRIMLPALVPGILAGVVFAFITSFDDAVLSVFLTDARSRTLPRVIFEGVRDETDPTIVALAAILVSISLLLFLLSIAFQSRRR